MFEVGVASPPPPEEMGSDTCSPSEIGSEKYMYIRPQKSTSILCQKVWCGVHGQLMRGVVAMRSINRVTGLRVRAVR